jgi:aryl-alcohol dehydrogenase-like predicted oxidoreductase
MGGGGDTRNFIPANRTDPKDPNAPNGRLEPSQIRAAVDASLRRLQTTYMDLLQLHWPDRYAPLWGANQFHADKCFDGVVPFEDQVAAVGELIKEGKIKHWGLSNETSYGVCKMVEAAIKLGVPPPISIQNDFSLLDRRFEGHLAETCHYTNIGLLPYGPLAGGTLAEKFFAADGPPAGSRHAKWPGFQARYHSERSVAAAREYRELATSKGMSVTTLALAWCKSRFYVASTIIGATTMDQLTEDVEAFEVDLDEETLKKIEEIHLKCRNPNVSD